MAYRGKSNRWEETPRPPVWEKDIPRWEKRRSRSRSRERETSSRYDRYKYDREVNRDFERKNREYERDRHRLDERKERDRSERDRHYEKERDSHRRERDRESSSRRERRSNERSAADREDSYYDRRKYEEKEKYGTSSSHDWSKYNYGGDSPEETKDDSPIREVEMEDSFGSPDTREHTPASKATTSSTVNLTAGDWYCTCGALNFKRRFSCYKRGCNGLRTIGSASTEENESSSNTGMSRNLIFRKLDALTNEEKVLIAIKERLPKIAVTITGITIGRDTLTGVSKGIAYVTFNSLTHSMEALHELTSLEPRLVIDEREVSIAYSCENSATPKSKPIYSSYPATYQSEAMLGLSEADRVNAAAAVAQSAISAMRTNMWMSTTTPAPVFQTTLEPVKSPPTGDGVTVYSAPKVQTFLYDETSGYYYDPSTGLYYDGSTQYFYNAALSRYMYWDAAKKVYVEATAKQKGKEEESSVETAPKLEEDKTKKRIDNQDKVKVAKKIAKDMEKWARTLNQRKESAKNNIVQEQPRDLGPSKGSADIGFSVLGSRSNVPSLPTIFHVPQSPPPMSAEEFLVKNSAIDDEEGVFDWDKFTCLLCKRQFPSADVLRKHRDMSDLHKTNLDAHRKLIDDIADASLIYRDRAAERRLKFGEASPPKPRYRASEVPIFSAPPVSVERVVDGIGSRMLEKMGWTEGKGLGKSEQGRIAPIEAERRPGTVGLGQKRGIYTAAPGETYRDTVKKLAIARYNDLVADEK